MYKIEMHTLGIHDGRIIYGETRQEVISKTFTYLLNFHKEFVGDQSVDKMAELEKKFEEAIVEIKD